jgi:hypothetical protein
MQDEDYYESEFSEADEERDGESGRWVDSDGYQREADWEEPEYEYQMPPGSEVSEEGGWQEGLPEPPPANDEL